jgi:hypothetical protein
MKSNVAESLVLTLIQAVKTALDAQHKLNALEKALKTYEPNLYQSYLKHLEENPRQTLVPEAFLKLQELLVQD